MAVTVQVLLSLMLLFVVVVVCHVWFPWVMPTTRPRPQQYQRPGGETVVERIVQEETEGARGGGEAEEEGSRGEETQTGGGVEVPGGGVEAGGGGETEEGGRGGGS